LPQLESCLHCNRAYRGIPCPGGCGGRGWVYREKTPYDLICISMCDLQRKNEQTKEREQR